MADGKVIIDTSLNNQGFVRGLNSMTKQTNGLTSAVKKLGAVIAGAFAVRQITAFGKECVELGSSIREVQNVVDVAFGDMTDRVEAFAAGAIRNFGMSQLAAKKTASTYMAMAKGMGVADETAADMSITLAGLTGDVASFYNISQELADIKLKSVFTGETETLKDLGVVMTQDNLAAYVLAQGITKSYDAMTQAEKVALRYNFVLDSLALANGDFARTSNSWANQTRILSMQWQEFMSIVGQSLIQVLTPLVRVLNQIISSMIAAAQTANTFISVLFGGADMQMAAAGTAAASVASEIEASVTNQNALTDATKATAKEQKKLLAGFDEINKLSGGTNNSEAGFGASIGTIKPLQIPDVTEPPLVNEKVLDFINGVRDAFSDLSNKVDWGKLLVSAKELGGTLSGLAGLAFDGLGRFWRDVLQPLGLWALNNAAPVFLDGLNEGLDLMADLAEVLLGEKSIGKLVSELTPLQTCLLGLAIALGVIATISGVATTFAAITGFIASVKGLGAIGLIGKLAEVIMLTATGAGTLSEAMSLVFGKGSILAGIGAIVGGAILAVTNFLSMLKNGFSWAREALMILGVALAAVGAIILGAPALVAGVVAAVVAAVATAAVVIKEHWVAIKEFGVAAWLAIKEAFSKAANWFKTNVMQPIKEGFKGFVNGLIGYVENFVNFFVRGINKIINAVNALSFDIPDIMGGGKIGFNLRNVGEIKLPRLATGAVIPPNREFMAVLGDQKSGTNIETPLATMVQAFKQAMAESGGGGAQTIILQIDGREFGRAVKKYGGREDQRVGVSLVGVRG